MRIAIAGLGIMGASVARALKANTEHVIHGWNRNQGVTDYSLSKGYIDGQVESFEGYDVVFVAMPPNATIQFLEDTVFSDGTIVTDLCGVKEPVQKAVYATKRNYRYVGSHPMAGKETCGVKSSSETLFKGANVILTNGKRTDGEALNTVAKLYRKMGCKKILLCPANYHDAKIAYTSQLAHIVSNAYLKSEAVDRCDGFTGGSFQDMTRVGGVDEETWTQLYFLNSDNVVNELQTLVDNLNEYLTALKDGDEEKMKELLRAGNEIRSKLKCYNEDK